MHKSLLMTEKWMDGWTGGQGDRKRNWKEEEKGWHFSIVTEINNGTRKFPPCNHQRNDQFRHRLSMDTKSKGEKHGQRILG